MKLYLAGIYSVRFDLTSNQVRQLDEVERFHRGRIQYFLESYHYVGRQSYVERMKRDGVKIFLDSGAFSAFTKGVEIDLNAYCDYIKLNQEILENIDGSICASVLDGIGDPLKTYNNQMAMEKQGVRPLPCFHYGEDEEYLKHYVANYKYITLGGMVMVTTAQLKLWLDRIWSRYLINTDGTPKVKVHGFGLTVPSIMGRYPWFSVDSSSWVHYSANGHIPVPHFENDQDPSLDMITISSHSSVVKNYGRHFLNIPPLQREALTAKIEGIGFSTERLKAHFVSRAAYCWFVYRRMQDNINKYRKPFKMTQEVFF